MKKIISNISKTLLIVGIVFATWSCSDDWLRPNPLSEFAPENVFVDEAGFLALLGQAEANMRWHWAGEGAFAIAEMRFSDVAVTGQTDQTVGFNWDVNMTPTGPLTVYNMRIFGWWYEAWHGINTANTVISRIDIWSDATEAQRNAILGAAYFHRSWRYFNLVNQFGDVPWLEAETQGPRTDYFSYCRWSILERLAEDLEFAYQWLPATAWRGRVNRYGAGVLLMKVHKSLLNFNRALEIGREIVAAHPMVMTRGTIPQVPGPRTTLMHDLHSPGGMMSASNSEAIHMIVSNPEGGPGASTMHIMRDLLPFWQSPFWNVPGLAPTAGMSMNPDVGFSTPNYNLRYGRGIARARPSHFYLFDVWDMDYSLPIAEQNRIPGPTNRHVNDMRSPLHMALAPAPPVPVREFSATTGRYEVVRWESPGGETLQRTGWRFPEDLQYNADAIRTRLVMAIDTTGWRDDGTPITEPVTPARVDEYHTAAHRAWFGRNVVRPAHVVHPITTPVGWSEYIRAWYHWPHYRWYVRSPVANEAMVGGSDLNVSFTPMHNGGPTPWYIYRSAEVHLMMAEAYYWTDRFPQAADQINLVRQRAGALPITAADIDIAMILAERARELSFEELRKSELTRIAFTYAKTGRPVSVFGGRVYSLDGFSGPVGSNINHKATGVNFFFDWIMHANNFMRDRIAFPNGTFTMSVHHVLWPIPNSVILANTTGHLNQNIGYAGSENNIPPRIVPPRPRN